MHSAVHERETTTTGRRAHELFQLDGDLARSRHAADYTPLVLR